MQETKPGMYMDPRQPLPPVPDADDLARANELALLREPIEAVNATIQAVEVFVARLKHAGIDVDEPFQEMRSRVITWLQERQREYDEKFRG